MFLCLFDVVIASFNFWTNFQVHDFSEYTANNSVIWTTCIMAAMVWSWDVSNAMAYSIYAALVFVATAITVIYLHIRDPTFHQVAYALLTALVLSRSIYLLHTRVDNAEARKNMWWMILIGVSTFLTGFFLWIIDNEFCDVLRSLRHQLGIPWAFFLGNILLAVSASLTLELHGWWYEIPNVSIYSI
jgi:dihydroceramidase